MSVSETAAIGTHSPLAIGTRRTAHERLDTRLLAPQQIRQIVAAAAGMEAASALAMAENGEHFHHARVMQPLPPSAFAAPQRPQLWKGKGKL